jgi:hypothetical protein
MRAPRLCFSNAAIGNANRTTKASALTSNTAACQLCFVTCMALQSIRPRQ